MVDLESGRALRQGALGLRRLERPREPERHPSGRHQRRSDRIEYNIRTNSSPDILETLNDLPVKQVGGATVYMRGRRTRARRVRRADEHGPRDGRLSALLAVLKTPPPRPSTSCSV